MREIDGEVEKRMALGGPKDIANLLVRIQNQLQEAKLMADRNGMQMTEGACDAALNAVRQALRLCQNGA